MTAAFVSAAAHGFHTMSSRPVARVKEAFPTLGDVATCFYKE